MVKADSKLVKEILALTVYASNHVVNLKLWENKKILKRLNRKINSKRKRVGNVHRNRELMLEEIDRLPDYQSWSPRGTFVSLVNALVVVHTLTHFGNERRFFWLSLFLDWDF